MEEVQEKVVVKTDGDKPKPSVKIFGFKQIIALSMAISTFCSAASLVIYHRWYAQKIVSVDLKGYVKLLGYKYGTGEIDDMKLRQAYDKMSQLVDAIPANQSAISADVALRNIEPYKLGHEEELKQYEEMRHQFLRKMMSGNGQGGEQQGAGGFNVSGQ